MALVGVFMFHKERAEAIMSTSAHGDAAYLRAQKTSRFLQAAFPIVIFPLAVIPSAGKLPFAGSKIAYIYLIFPVTFWGAVFGAFFDAIRRLCTLKLAPQQGAAADQATRRPGG